MLAVTAVLAVMLAVAGIAAVLAIVLAVLFPGLIIENESGLTSHNTSKHICGVL